MNAKREPHTRVVFRMYPGRLFSGGYAGIIALFPDIPYCTDGMLCTSYEPVGQHGAADYAGVIAATRPATPDEYAPLRRELDGAPYHYNCRPVSRRSAIGPRK